MDEMVRQVLARYRDDPNNEKPYADRIPWMEYVQERAEDEEPESVDPDKADGPDSDNISEQNDNPCTTNPYDYEDPSSKPKDQKDSGPFVNSVFPEIETAYFSRPKVFKEQGELGDWWAGRDTDWTEDPTEQRPAISIDRKYASSVDPQAVIAQYMLGYIPLQVEASDCGCGGLHKEAASLREVVQKDAHYTKDRKVRRAMQCNVHWDNQNKDKQVNGGLFRFRVRSQGSGEAHTVVMQFVRPEEATYEQYRKYTDYPVEMACSCPSFLFYGAQYYAVTDKYMYMPFFRPSLLSPRDVWVSSFSPRHHGKGKYFRVCKHIMAVYREVDKWAITKPYHEYPPSGPASKIINADEWQKLMGFEFSEDEIKKRLKSPKPYIPPFFAREAITQGIIDWFNNVWINRDDWEKANSLKTMVEWPERVYFILIKEAELQRAKGQTISDRLIHEGYQLMARVIKPAVKPLPEPEEEEVVPEEVRMPVPPPGSPQVPPGAPEPPAGEAPEQTLTQQVQQQKGTGFAPPDGDISAEEFLKGRIVKKEQPLKGKRIQPGAPAKPSKTVGTPPPDGVGQLPGPPETPAVSGPSTVQGIAKGVEPGTRFQV